LEKEADNWRPQYNRLGFPSSEPLAMSYVTRILSQIDAGDPYAAEQLLPLVYDELRKLAAAKLAHEKPGQTLDATGLVHEAYLRLIGSEPRTEPGSASGGRTDQSGPPEADRTYDNRGHFFAAAATAMRRILVENARRKGRVKHGGQLQRVELVDLPADQESERLLALDEALTRLAAEDHLAARVVELRHFAGLGHERVAAALKITVYEARQKWTYARAWLQTALDGE
jgi:DNA-directed RNA polymerase specialized sigma24 family protein